MFNAIENFFFKWSLRLFMPGLARQMAIDGTLDLDPEKMPEFIRVIDNKADITIFAFSGLDVVFAGFARYEFGQILLPLRKKCNFVFIRDIHRMAYHMSPDGEWTGLEFYRKEIEEVQQQLGAKYNISLGSSSGGSAAFYFGTICKMDKFIVFGPAFPYSVYTNWKSRLKTFFNVKMLLTSPATYLEQVIVTIGAISTANALARNIAEEEAWHIVEAYREADPRPAATVFFGKKNAPDSHTARIVDEFPEVKIVPLDTGRHNTPDFLNKRRELGPRMVEEVEEVFKPRTTREVK